MDNQKKIDLIIQYALLAAGQEDDFKDRQLGPIHIVKYIYIADLLYSRENNGETFTGLEWKFHKFGPWSATAHSRIEPALQAINANKKSFPSNYENKKDWDRWSLVDDQLFAECSRLLPIQITNLLSRLVHQFGKDTPSLLHFVYDTPPMRNAAPGEFLDFSFAVPKPVTKNDDFVPLMKKLSTRQKKKFKSRLEELRQRNQKRLQERRSKPKRIPSRRVPLYDEVYKEGMEWLDSLAGPPLPEGNFEAVFDDSIWKSSGRTLNDIS